MLIALVVVVGIDYIGVLAIQVSHSSRPLKALFFATASSFERMLIMFLERVLASSCHNQVIFIFVCLRCHLIGPDGRHGWGPSNIESTRGNVRTLQQR